MEFKSPVYQKVSFWLGWHRNEKQAVRKALQKEPKSISTTEKKENNRQHIAC